MASLPIVVLTKVHSTTENILSESSTGESSAVKPNIESISLSGYIFVPLSVQTRYPNMVFN